jgi:hypothetical protein
MPTFPEARTVSLHSDEKTLLSERSENLFALYSSYIQLTTNLKQILR